MHSNHFQNTPETKPVHGNIGNKRSSQNTSTATQWLHSFIQHIGEQQPNSAFIHLPSYLDKTKMFNEMLEEIQLDDPNFTMSASQFFNIWHSEFSNVKIPATTRLGKCNECAGFVARRASIRTAEDLKKWKGEKIAHLGAVSKERQLLTQRKVAAEHNPLEYHHIIIDGMTMMYLPNVQPMPKGASQAARMKYHVTGIIDHTFKEQSLFFSPNTLEGGASHTCTILANHLMMIRKDKGRRPRHLQIQTDNCFRENKNTTVFGFAALLVQHGIYETVTISMLIPGHTHEDIDQMFSTLSKYYWSHTLESLEHIKKFVKEAYKDETKRPKVYITSWTWDFKSLVAKHLCHMKKHSKPR
jgi:hypothetical protein